LEKNLSWKTAAIEAILFASGDSLPLKELEKNLELSPAELTQCLEMLENRYMQNESGLQLKYFEQSVQLATKGAYGDIIARLLTPVKTQNLSQSALEALTIIAYRQPITRGEIESIRGVRSEYAMQVLTNLGMIEEKGRKDALGHPILYGTTEQFLRAFGLESLEALPPLGKEE